MPDQIIKEKEVREVESKSSTAMVFFAFLIIAAIVGYLLWYFMGRPSQQEPQTQNPGINLDINLPNGTSSAY